MNALTFTIKLLEPLLAQGLEGDPNAGVSLKYIPGSVLRGAIAGLYLREGNEIDASVEVSRDLFFNGKVCYLNSYPQIGGQRSFPTPFAWQREKDIDSDSFYNFAIEPRKEKTSYKKLDFPFFAFENGNDVIAVSPKFRLAVHTRRDAQKGRATSDDGAVFRYESIAEGTKFCGAIISENEDWLNKIERLIENHKTVVFGGSRSAGYGKAEFKDVKINVNWKEFEPIDSGKNEISVYALSNILIRNGHGNFKSELTAEDFKINAAKTFEKTFVQTETVGGFNQEWGLPLPQMLSIKAGSIFTFALNQTASTDELKKLVENGIGERKSEGFGRITFDLTNFDTLNEVGAVEVVTSDITLPQTKLRDRILERVLRQKLDSQLIIKIDGFDIKGNLNNSQISRLRMFIRKLLQSGNKDLNQLDNFYGNLKGKGREQFESVKVGSKQFIAWTKTAHFENTWSVKLGGAEINGESLQNEYNLLLIDGVLAKKSKEH